MGDEDGLPRSYIICVLREDVPKSNFSFLSSNIFSAPGDAHLGQ